MKTDTTEFVFWEPLMVNMRVPGMCLECRGETVNPMTDFHPCQYYCISHSTKKIALVLTAQCYIHNLQLCIQISRGVKLIFMGGHISLVVAFKGPNVILRLYKCNYSLTGERSSTLPPGRNKVRGWIKQGGGLDSARRPCVCHLRFRQFEQKNPPLLFQGTNHKKI